VWLSREPLLVQADGERDEDEHDRRHRGEQELAPTTLDERIIDRLQPAKSLTLVALQIRPDSPVIFRKVAAEIGTVETRVRDSDEQKRNGQRREIQGDNGEAELAHKPMVIALCRLAAARRQGVRFAAEKSSPIGGRAPVPGRGLATTPR